MKNDDYMVARITSFAICVGICIVFCAGYAYMMSEGNKLFNRKDKDMKEDKAETVDNSVNVYGHRIGKPFEPRPEYKLDWKGETYKYAPDSMTSVVFMPENGILKSAMIVKGYDSSSDCHEAYNYMCVYYKNTYNATVVDHDVSRLRTEDGTLINIKVDISSGLWIINVIIIGNNK